MRILHLIQRYPPAIGGSEQWCREVCQRLAAAGDEVKVLTLDVLEEEEFWHEPPVERRTRLGRLDWDGRVLVRRYRRTLPVPLVHDLLLHRLLDQRLGVYFYGPHSVEMYTSLHREIRTADVVHLHTIPYAHNLVGYLIARRLGKRVVITPYFHPGHLAYERRCHYWLLRRCDVVIVLSDYERDHLTAAGVDRERIVVTGAGIDPDEYAPADLPGYGRALRARLGLDEATRLVLFVGRKADYKGIPVLIDAVRRLRDRHDVALLLVGPALSWFDELYARVPAAERRRIVDLGTVPHQEKVNLLRLADVLVLPSEFESFGIVFPEAWICGTPVIGSTAGALPSVIGPGGLTFETGNAAALAGAIDAVLGDPQRARELAARGLERVRGRYTWSSIAAAVRSTYRPDGRTRTRILVVSSLFPPGGLGGAELVAAGQARLLAEMGHEVEVFAGRLEEGGAGSAEAGAPRGAPPQVRVALARRDLAGVWWNVADPRVVAAFTRMLERFRPEVVHFHNLAGLAVILIDVCRHLGIPTVLTLHDYWGLCFKNTMIKNDGRRCERSGIDCLECREIVGTKPPLPSPVRNGHVARSLLAVDRLISPSRFLAERYAAHGVPRAKLTVIPNGVDTERFTPRRARRDVLTLGFVGYLGPHKGPAHLLRALGLVRDRERVRLLVVGEGAEEERLRALCGELGIAPRVSFRGPVASERMPDVYAELDVLVVPSVWAENSPVTITEAMASGLPVIASAVGGIGELVEDGATGVLVPPGDVAALAARIEHFLAHPEHIDAMGARGLEKIRAYDARRQVERLLEVYREVVERGAGAAPAGAEVVLYDGGDRWNALVLDMLRRLAQVEDELGRRLLPCLAALVDEETFRRARVLVIPSSGPHVFERAVQALERRVPLLVHESAEEVAALCRLAGAGLAYGPPGELVEGLRALLGDEPRRAAMGTSGRRFVETHGRPVG